MCAVCTVMGVTESVGGDGCARDALCKAGRDTATKERKEHAHTRRLRTTLVFYVWVCEERFRMTIHNPTYLQAMWEWILVKLTGVKLRKLLYTTNTAPPCKKASHHTTASHTTTRHGRLDRGCACLVPSMI